MEIARFAIFFGLGVAFYDNKYANYATKMIAFKDYQLWHIYGLLPNFYNIF